MITFSTLYALFAPPLWTWLYETAVRKRVTRRVLSWFQFWLLAAGASAVAAAVAGPSTDIGAAGVSALIAVAVWWWRRRKNRLKALRTVGHKARARLAAMARNMPRPAPRLVPEPA